MINRYTLKRRIGTFVIIMVVNIVDEHNNNTNYCTLAYSNAKLVY